MKEKILSALKTKYKTLGFGDKAFEGVANYLSTSVTEESQIETATAGVENLLKAFQGDIDKVRGEKSTIQKELDELKAKGAGADPNQKPEPQPGNDLDAKIAAALEAKVKPLQDELNSYKIKEARTTRQTMILNKAKELGIPQWRIDEGFIIADDADETVILTKLSGIKQNIVTAGLEKGGGFPVDPKIQPTKEEVSGILDKIGI